MNYRLIGRSIDVIQAAFDNMDIHRMALGISASTDVSPNDLKQGLEELARECETAAKSC